MSASTRGKSLERRCAELYGGERVGATGKADPDVVTPHLVIECKRGYGLAIESAWIEQARNASGKRGLPWIIVHGMKGSSLHTVTMDERLAIRLLTKAGMIEYD